MSCNLKWNTKCYENKLLVSRERRDALLAKYYHKNIKCSENCENNKLWKKDLTLWKQIYFIVSECFLKIFLSGIRNENKTFETFFPIL